MLDNIDKYATNGLSVVNVPKAFRPHINPVYPPNNNLIFEEWFRSNYVGCSTDRIYLDIFPTSYWVNNDYANDKLAKQALQDYVDFLPTDKKYFSICQYDDGFLLDWKGKDVLEFNMSKNIGVQMPLICQPHPFKFAGGKKWFASFVGSRTHPVRDELEKLKSVQGYYISYDPHNIETYCRILHESMFTLCPRGYGANSFRVAEAIQYGSIPVYISDEFIRPYDMDFHEFGVMIGSDYAWGIDDILQSIELDKIIEKQNKLQEVYEKYYTYEGNLNQIIKHLEIEHYSRQPE